MFNLRPFDKSERDYQAVISIWNTVWPEDLMDINEYRHDDEERNPDYFWHRLIIEKDDQIIGFGIYCETWWSAKPGKYYVNCVVHPAYQEQGAAVTFYKHVMAVLAARDEFNLLTTETRENKKNAIDFLTKRGFHQVMREPNSHLYVPDFDATPYHSLPKKMAQSGITIHSIAELEKTDPNWLHKLYELKWELIQDVPSPDERTKQPFAEFKKMVDSPRFLPHGYFIALDGDQFVGTSALWYSEAEKHKLYTGLTGVLRSHRRRGIATAMKLRAIQYAQQNGVEIIETDNEENNPMYQLNLQLGFKPRPAFLIFHKTIMETLPHEYKKGEPDVQLTAV